MLTSSFESVLPAPPLRVSEEDFLIADNKQEEEMFSFSPHIFWKFFMFFFVSECIETLFSIFKLCMLEMRMNLPVSDCPR